MFLRDNFLKKYLDVLNIICKMKGMVLIWTVNYIKNLVDIFCIV